MKYIAVFFEVDCKRKCTVGAGHFKIDNKVTKSKSFYSSRLQCYSSEHRSNRLRTLTSNIINAVPNNK
ncbi:unnamed protein product [Amoebophrya sp. A25]|nr:unnamed protein product [Amoebophrya sp. A25]|eukprot:GSA25T00000951001.1